MDRIEEILNKNAAPYQNYGQEIYHADSSVKESMKEYAQEISIAFLEYYQKYRGMEYRYFRKECERIGGIFTFANETENGIYSKFINKEPIEAFEVDGKKLIGFSMIKINLFTNRN